jgi:hypothetical protein
MITDLEEETRDIDWFSVDSKGEIAHFTSGGQGFLPPSVKASNENLQRVTMFFRQLLPNGDAVESSNLSSHIYFDLEAQKSRYLEAFSGMAEKGLFSFDCVMDAPERPSSYFMVAKPSHPVNIGDLPEDIRNILGQTYFSGEFSNEDMIIPDDIA